MPPRTPSPLASRRTRLYCWRSDLRKVRTRLFCRSNARSTSATPPTPQLQEAQEPQAPTPQLSASFPPSSSLSLSRSLCLRSLPALRARRVGGKPRERVPAPRTPRRIRPPPRPRTRPYQPRAPTKHHQHQRPQRKQPPLQQIHPTRIIIEPRRQHVIAHACISRTTATTRSPHPLRHRPPHQRPLLAARRMRGKPGCKRQPQHPHLRRQVRPQHARPPRPNVHPHLLFSTKPHSNPKCPPPRSHPQPCHHNTQRKQHPPRQAPPASNPRHIHRASSHAPSLPQRQTRANTKAPGLRLGVFHLALWLFDLWQFRAAVTASCPSSCADRRGSPC